MWSLLDHQVICIPLSCGSSCVEDGLLELGTPVLCRPSCIPLGVRFLWGSFLCGFSENSSYWWRQGRRAGSNVETNSLVFAIDFFLLFIALHSHTCDTICLIFLYCIHFIFLHFQVQISWWVLLSILLDLWWSHHSFTWFGGQGSSLALPS